MSLTVSVCCGAAVTFFHHDTNPCWECKKCLSTCATETIAERDHRMRVEGAVAAILKHFPEQRDDRSTREEAQAIVREMKQGAKR